MCVGGEMGVSLSLYGWGLSSKKRTRDGLASSAGLLVEGRAPSLAQGSAG